MKIKPEHYEYMKNEIAKVWSKEKHEVRTQFVWNEGIAKDVNKRVRHDWAYCAGLSTWICDNVYSYADDAHVDTALKQIMQELSEGK